MQKFFRDWNEAESYRGIDPAFVDQHDIEILTQLNAELKDRLDDEALRVVKSLKTWKPGKEKGKAVKVAYTVPINFALAEKGESKNEKK